MLDLILQKMIDKLELNESTLSVFKELRSSISMVSNAKNVEYLLQIACEYNLLCELHELLELNRFPDINKAIDDKQCLLGNPPSKTLLSFASIHGNIEIVKYLLDVRGANANARNSDGTTASHQLAYGDEVRLVLEKHIISLNTPRIIRGNPTDKELEDFKKFRVKNAVEGYVKTDELNYGYSSLEALTYDLSMLLRSEVNKLSDDVRFNHLPLDESHYLGQALDNLGKYSIISGISGAVISGVSYYLTSNLPLTLAIGFCFSLLLVFTLFHYRVQQSKTESNEKCRRYKSIFKETNNSKSSRFSVIRNEGSRGEYTPNIYTGVTLGQQFTSADALTNDERSFSPPVMGL